MSSTTPGEVAPFGTIFASVKDRDGPNDRAANLSRPGVYRLAVGLRPDAYTRRFGAIPKRPPKGRAVTLEGHDLTRLDVLTPHPVYAWMCWVQVLAPTPADLDALQPLLEDSLQLVKAKWKRRTA